MFQSGKLRRGDRSDDDISPLLESISVQPFRDVAA
jgi:hypothetical protein